MTHKLWKNLLRTLQDIHGVREASPEAIWELHKLVDAVEAKFLTFTLAKGELGQAIVPDSPESKPDFNRGKLRMTDEMLADSVRHKMADRKEPRSAPSGTMKPEPPPAPPNPGPERRQGGWYPPPVTEPPPAPPAPPSPPTVNGIADWRKAVDQKLLDHERELERLQDDLSRFVRNSC